MVSRGKFIVLEGIDGCGKTTIARLLARRTGALVTKEPTRQSAAGKKIHEILRHKQPTPSALDIQRLYIADRGAHTKKIKAALARGRMVIAQRYALSTFAYGMAFGVAEQDLQHDFLKPNLTILLDISADVAMRRIAGRKKGREYFEKKEKLEKIRAQYLKLAKNHKAVVIDATPAPDVLVEKILSILRI